MARLNAVESDMQAARDILEKSISPECMELIAPLFESSEMGMRSFRILASIRPLVASVWSSLSANGDPNRFAVENMLRDIDSVLGYWVVSDEKEDTKISEK